MASLVALVLDLQFRRATISRASSAHLGTAANKERIGKRDHPHMMQLAVPKQMVVRNAWCNWVPKRMKRQVPASQFLRLCVPKTSLRNPNVGIIFLIPGVTHTLRVSGKAIIVRDEILRDSMKVNGKTPNHVLVVGVERVFSHCPRCMMRSGLWQPDTWGEPTAVPSFAATLVAHAKTQHSVEQMQAIIEKGHKERL